MSLLKKVRSDKRKLAILRLLQSEPDYKISSIDLQDTLALMGHGVALFQINIDVAELHKLKLVSINEGDGVVVTLLHAGIDVANGLSAVHGVARPSPQMLQALDAINATLGED